MKITLLLIVFVVFGLTNCSANTVEAPADVAAPPEDAVCAPNKLCSKVLTPGTGDVHPDAWDEVTVHYSGWTTDGSLFDSSLQRGQTATFPLNRVIAGWTEGLQLMVVGEKRRFWIPKELAYNDMPGRPAGMLVFDIELFSIQDKPAPPPAPPVPDDVAGPPTDAEVTASGLASKMLRPGVGDKHPTTRSKVTVHYSGWTTDGQLFDSSVQRGEPISFSLTQVIAGWTEGVQLMVVGEKRRFWIPEGLAYRGQPGAPPGMLVFDVELISFEE